MSESRVPGWVWIFTPTVAIAFAGFILYLSTLPASDELDAVKGEAKDALRQSIDKAQERVFEEIAGKTEYDFYELLKEQKVEIPDDIDAYVSTPKDAELSYSYLLQVGSFRTEQDAETMRADLMLMGLQGFHESVDVKGSTWYRVFAGPFDNRSTMNKAQDILASENISPLLVKKPVAKSDE